jgi:hypothetical protein
VAMVTSAQPNHISSCSDSSPLTVAQPSSLQQYFPTTREDPGQIISSQQVNPADALPPQSTRADLRSAYPPPTSRPIAEIRKLWAAIRSLRLDLEIVDLKLEVMSLRYDSKEKLKLKIERVEMERKLLELQDEEMDEKHEDEENEEDGSGRRKVRVE